MIPLPQSSKCVLKTSSFDTYYFLYIMRQDSFLAQARLELIGSHS